MFGIFPGLILGLLVLMGATASERLLQVFETPGRIARCFRIGSVFCPLIVGVMASFHASDPKSRLGGLLNGAIQVSVINVRVAGFNSFLAVRCYARFSIASDDLPPLVRRLGLSPSTITQILKSLRTQSPFALIARKAGILPDWAPAMVWSNSEQSDQATRWCWIVADATGTNAFISKGFQN